jgi:hypothetical protein
MPHRTLPPGPLRDVVVTFGVVLFVGGAPTLMRRWWRDPSSVPDMPHLWRRRSFDRVRRGRRRQAPLVAAALAFGSIGLLAETFASRFPPLGFVEDPAFALAMVCVVLACSVRALNRPRFVVPPSLRDEPGALREILDNRRRRADGS